MKVISSVYDEKKNASVKAPSDIDVILEREFGADVTRIVRKGKFGIKIALAFVAARFWGEETVLQYPLTDDVRKYRILNLERSVILIHDIRGIRNMDEKLLENEIEIFKLFKYVIVHNEVMKKFLVGRGVKEENIFVLELFDYLVCGGGGMGVRERGKKLMVAYSGNSKKSPFLYELDEKKMKFEMNFYGVLEGEISNKKIRYGGAFEPREVPLKIEGDLGLVWDGAVDESDENESYKNYTKYNNPHKLSCYIAANMPVVVWEKSAASELVKKYDIGYVIRDLYEINNLDLSDYKKKAKNVAKLGEKVRSGYFTKRVMTEVCEKMEGDGKAENAGEMSGKVGGVSEKMGGAK